MSLTKTIIDNATYRAEDGKRFVLWDDDVVGLGLRVYPSGKKTFLLMYRAQGQKRLMALGKFVYELRFT